MDLTGGEAEPCRGVVGVGVADRAGPRDRQRVPRSMQVPGECDLVCGCAVALGDVLDRRPDALHVGAVEAGWPPRREHDVGSLGGGEMCAAEPRAEVVVGGEGGDLDNLASGLELL